MVSKAVQTCRPRSSADEEGSRNALSLITTKVTFTLIQGHWCSCHSIGYTSFPICRTSRSRTPTCDGRTDSQTDRQTPDNGIYRASKASRGNKIKQTLVASPCSIIIIIFMRTNLLQPITTRPWWHAVFEKTCATTQKYVKSHVFGF